MHDEGTNPLKLSHGYFDKQGIAKVDLRKVLMLQKEKESFHWFIDTIALAVVGTAVAEKVKYLKPPREWLSQSLEAFALLCLVSGKLLGYGEE